jgi:hypothetical protein
MRREWQLSKGERIILVAASERKYPSCRTVTTQFRTSQRACHRLGNGHSFNATNDRN